MEKDEGEYKRIKSESQKSRKKNWAQKVSEVSNSFSRAKQNEAFFDIFYKNFFFLKPDLEKYFVNTKWIHQKIAIKKSIEHLLGFLSTDPERYHHKNILRLSVSHSVSNLAIHPHNYYYWIEAMIMTLKEFDDQWYSDLEYYTRECLFFPISFMISLYHRKE